jgi:5-methyltetrahydropteroyltriglutamate--homocysteine methyltransferase
MYGSGSRDLNLVPGKKLPSSEKEVAVFPEYYEQYFKEAMMVGTSVRTDPVACAGPKCQGEAAVQKDIANVNGEPGSKGHPRGKSTVPHMLRNQ